MKYSLRPSKASFFCISEDYMQSYANKMLNLHFYDKSIILMRLKTCKDVLYYFASSDWFLVLHIILNCIFFISFVDEIIGF